MSKKLSPVAALVVAALMSLSVQARACVPSDPPDEDDPDIVVIGGDTSRTWCPPSP